MFMRYFRPSLSVVLAAVVLCLSCQEASANVIAAELAEVDLPSGTTSPIVLIPQTTIRQTHRLTRNRVDDAKPLLSDGVIYWERFGGYEGDTEIYSFDVDTRAKARLTKNRLDDTLQSPGVWISAPRSPYTSYDYVNPTSLSPRAIALSQRARRKTDIYQGTNRITRNKLRYETSVRVAEDSSHGMVWLSKRVPFANTGILTPKIASAYDVFWYNGQNHKTYRLTDKPIAKTVAFGGPWAAWNTITGDELVIHHVNQGITRTLDINGAYQLDVAGSNIKYEVASPHEDSPFESRVYVYDAEIETTIEVGVDDTLDFYDDSMSVLDDHYVAYSRSLWDPSGPVTSTYYGRVPRHSTELRLFDIYDLTDILVTEGLGISDIYMNDDMLVWKMLDQSAPSMFDWDYEIFAYDIVGGTIRQVTDNNVDDKSPQVDGDLIVWETLLANGSTEIIYEKTFETFMFDVTVPVLEPVTFNPIAGLPITTLRTVERSKPALVAAAVPEPASALLLSAAGLAIAGRRRPRTHVA